MFWKLVQNWLHGKMERFTDLNRRKVVRLMSEKDGPGIMMGVVGRVRPEARRPLRLCVTQNHGRGRGMGEGAMAEDFPDLGLQGSEPNCMWRVREVEE